jgi:hypothetical protein
MRPSGHDQASQESHEEQQIDRGYDPERLRRGSIG